jgi:hypothetical protein
MVCDTTEIIGGSPVLMLSGAGSAIADERAAADLIGDALSEGAGTVVIPIERLGESFFDLRSGLAGLIVNKFVVYRIRLVLVGDIASYEATSKAFRDFVREANRGDQLSFVPTVDAAIKLLSAHE